MEEGREEGGRGGQREERGKERRECFIFLFLQLLTFTSRLITPPFALSLTPFPFLHPPPPLTSPQISESHDPPQPSALKCHKRSSTITTSTSPSTPPHSHTPHTSHPTPKHPTPPKQPRETASPSSTRLISQGSSPSSPSSPLPSSNKTMRTGSPKKGERPRTTPLSSPAVSPTKQRHLKEPSSPSLHWQKKRTRTHSHTQSSPTRGVHSERGGGEGGTESTPQRKVPSVLNGLWSRMSELDRVKRVKILAERVMKVRG